MYVIADLMDFCSIQSQAIKWQGLHQ